jgi:anti-sigma regulatory factor (Ser/Thr protein kinase)
LRESFVSDEATRLEVPAEVGRLAEVRAFVRARLGMRGLDSDAVADVVQAVDECVANVITHGYIGRPGRVEIEVDVGSAAVAVHVRDRAPAFDPTTVPEPAEDRPLEARLRGGMGIHLIREFTDEFRYRLLPDGRNEVTMIKRIGMR